MIDDEVFISYAWGGESEEIANKVDAAFLQKQITLIRDKRDLGFKGLITDFMRQIGRGKAVISIISDKYLKSPYCMFELLEIFRNSDFVKRIFPIVLSDAKIFEPLPRLEYYKYWQDKKQELDTVIRQYGTDAVTVVGNDFIIYKRIYDNIGEILNLLRDINSLTPEMHEASGFQEVITAVCKLLEIDKTFSIAQIRQLLNASFDDITLQSFCQMYFEEVYNNFGAGMSKTQRIIALIDFCQRRMKLEMLVDCIKLENPEQYDKFKKML